MKTKPNQKIPSVRGDADVSPGKAMTDVPRVLTDAKRQSGVALLIVLGMLVLLSVIVLAFVTQVTTDLGDSKAYESQTNTRMLADSAVNLVEMEIRAASTAANQAWISQPGLLRTYDTNGNAVAAYKLYSASQMIVPGAFDPNAGTDLPTGSTWLGQPNLYVDLNSPVASGTTTTGSTNYIFPIIDGNGLQKITTSGSTVLTYSTDGTLPTIEGFATNPTTVGINYSGSNTLSATNNPVPMPVQWLYMLKDGTLIPATGVANSKDVIFTGTVVPSGTNPIVARIAFWTDDESCKVNINTASEGTFWDTPVCVTQPNVSDAGDPDPQGKSVFDPNQIFEWDLAQREPDRNEYQRYPGHPATTCMSPIIGDTVYKNLKLSSIATTGTGPGYHSLTGSGWAEFAEMINQFAPRVSGMDATATSWTSGSDYSSRGGSYRAGGSSLYSSNVSSSIGTGTAITPDQMPLYATVDEYFYSGTIPSTPTVTVSATTRVQNGVLMTGTSTTSGTIINPILPPSLLEKARFFLTANSSAPELNVFNMPRVSIWPITKTATTLDNPDTSNSAVTATMTNFDKVIAFDATVSGTSSGLGNKIPFYFSRFDPFSQTADYANSQNNQNLYTYLHNFMNQPFPGLSASSSATFVSKYPTEDIGSANQILTEIYDYIRCTNLMDTSQDIYGTTPYGSTSYTMVNPNWQWTDPQWNSLTSQGQVTPIVIPTSAVSGSAGLTAGTPYTRGIGRYAIPGEMTMVMLKQDERMVSSGSEGALENSIVVSSGQYSGTWKFNQPQPNMNNILIKENSTPPYIYQQPTPTTPPTQDYGLLPGAGGLGAVSSGTGKNTYDPRSQTKLQIVLEPYYFSPMAGYSALANNIRYHWSNVSLDFVGNGSGPANTGTVAVTPGPTGTYASGTQGQDLYDSGRIDTINESEGKIGGPMGPKSLIDPSASTVIPSNTGAPADAMYQVLEVVVNGTSAQSFSGTSPNTMSISGSATLQIMAPAIPVTWSARGISDTPAVIQTINFSWPKTTVQIPALNSQNGTVFPFVALQGGTSTLSGNTSTAEAMIISATTSGSTAAQVTVKTGASRMTPGGNWGNYTIYMAYPTGSGTGVGNVQDIFRSLQLSGTMSNNVPIEGDFRLVAATGIVPSSWYQPIQKYPSSCATIPDATKAVGSVSSGSLTPYYDSTQQYEFGWRTCIFYSSWPNTTPPGNLIANVSGNSVTFPVYADNRFSPYVPLGVNGVYNYLGSPGDWDNGAGWIVDGAYCNKPDEGWIRHYEAQQDFVASSVAPFIGHAFDAEDSALGLPTLYGPNKMISSPVMFGSLPTGVLAMHPWQTLLFRPAKSYLPGGSSGALSGSPVHPGAAVGGNGGLSPGTGVIPYPPYSTLPDHALLDLFWMPVVDPYPISEPFSTAGKVNLNYQIAPFTYITRNTALRAVLQSVKITAMNPTITDNETSTNPAPPSPYTYPPQFSMDYKTPGSFGNSSDSTGGIGNGGGLGVCVRRNIDLDHTIEQIDYLRFGIAGGGNSVNKPFITASEICDIPLIPGDLPNVGNVQPVNIGSQIKGTTPGNYDSILATFWYGNGSSAPFGHRLTGDNSLERPYSMIYPRLTTKSNTYTVHVRVQTVKKSQNTPVAMFKDGQDQVTGEFRGSFVIERYLDPTSTGFYLNGNTSSPVSMTTAGAQLGPYKFRIVSSKQFGQ